MIYDDYLQKFMPKVCDLQVKNTTMGRVVAQTTLQMTDYIGKSVEYLTLPMEQTYKVSGDKNDASKRIELEVAVKSRIDKRDVSRMSQLTLSKRSTTFISCTPRSNSSSQGFSFLDTTPVPATPSNNY